MSIDENILAFVCQNKFLSSITKLFLLLQIIIKEIANIPCIAPTTNCYSETKVDFSSFGFAKLHSKQSRMNLGS